jgi:ADP-heptose:LPS heptosyltransferase
MLSTDLAMPLQRWVVRAYLRAANSGLWLLTTLLFPERPSPVSQRTVVFRSGSIGDMLVAVPAFKALRRRNCSGSILLINPCRYEADAAGVVVRGAELLKAARLCDEVVYPNARSRSLLSGMPAVRLQVRQFAPDSAVIMPYTGESFLRLARKLLYLRAMGVRVRPQGARLHSAPFFRRMQHVSGMLHHQAATALLAAQPSQPSVRSRDLALESAVLPCNPGAEARLAEKLGALLSGATTPIVIVGVSAKFAHKRWPVENFAAVLRRIAARSPILPVTVGSASDRSVAALLCDALGGGALNLCGQLALDETLELCRKAALFLGNDSGASHVAAAAGIPTITVFSGIQFPGVWEPIGHSETAVRTAIPCQGCYSEEVCPTGTSDCMRAIAPEEVLRIASACSGI